MVRWRHWIWIALLLCGWGRGGKEAIVNNIPEHQANEIMVLLASKGIPGEKSQQSSPSSSTGGSAIVLWNVLVPSNQKIEAMSILCRAGLPKRPDESLLDLFQNTGLMSSEMQDNIRYQVGLENELQNMICLIDGINVARVKICLPKESILGGESESSSPSASVFIKLIGVMNEPNALLELKIKRLIASSVPGLAVENVTVVSDRSRLTDILLDQEEIQISKLEPEVSIWSILVNSQSVSRFRFLFSSMLFLCFVSLMALVWILWKMYPFLASRGWSSVFSPRPFQLDEKTQLPASREEKDDLNEEEETL